MVQKKLISLVVFLLVVVLLGGVLTPAFGGTKITYWHPWGGRWGEKQNEIVQQFNKENPYGIEVEVVQVPGGEIVNKLITADMGGNPPDVFTVWSGIDLVLADKICTPLDKFVAKDPRFSPKKYYPGALEWLTYKGKLLGLPWVGALMGLYYNKAHLKQAGLPVRAPKTWKELETFADKTTIKDPQGKYKRFGFIPPYGWWNFVVQCSWQNGGEWWDYKNWKFTATNPKNIEAVKWIASFVDKYGIKNITEFNTAASASPCAFADELFTFTYDGCWTISAIRDYKPKLDYDVAPFPVPEGGRPVSVWFNDCMYMSNKSKNLDAAWKFLSWMATEGTRRWCIWALEQPARYEISRESVYQEDKHFRAFSGIAKYSRTLISFPLMSLFSDKIGTTMESIMYKEKTPETALSELENIIQKELDKYK
jgi:multiple sugar transport system substrate-binding protein